MGFLLGNSAFSKYSPAKILPIHSMKEKYILIGAGSAMFTKGLITDLIRRGNPSEVVLVDVDSQALEVAERLARKMIAASQAPIALTAQCDRRQALPGATVVICTIGVGGRRAWEQDVFIPRKYGIYQPVGDSVMPGGSSRALRMIPAMVDIARDVLDLAPQALFFNYGNPMAPICQAVRKATGANLIGLCHGVFDVGRYLAKTLDVATHDLTYSAVGMNHLTWFTEIRVRGVDVMPQLLALAEKKSRVGAPNDQQGHRLDLKGIDPDTADNPFAWELLRLFGAFPAVLDRHITEFFPQFFADGKYYGKTLGVDAYSFESTIAYGDKIFQEMRRDALSPTPLAADEITQFSSEHEQVIEIVESIRGDLGRVYSANLPNRGQAPNLPENALIECPVIANGSGLHPILQPALSSGVAGTLATRLYWVETIVEAALEGSRDKFVRALILDGAVDSLDAAKRLADELLGAHASYLPQFKG